MKIGNIEVYGIIYKITNKINGKVYIGQTTEERGFNGRYNRKGVGVERFYKRHKGFKDYGHPYNRHLLESIEKYGVKSFEVIEVFDVAFSRKELDIKEKLWILIYNSYKDGYNNNTGGEGNSGYEGFKHENNPNHRSVVQLSLKGDFIKMWGSISQATESIGISHSHISQVCCNKRKSSGGYIWIYKENYNPDIKYEYIRDNRSKKRSVCVMNLGGKIIGTYESLTEAAIKTKSDYKAISEVCLGRKKTHNNLIFVFKAEYDEEKDYAISNNRTGCKKDILVFDSNDNYIETLKCVQEVVDKYNYSKTTFIKYMGGKNTRIKNHSFFYSCQDLF